MQPPTPAVPRSELVLKTYALGAADRAAMREMYLASATEHAARLAEYRTQHARAVQDGADDPRHPRFGAYATLELGIATEAEIVRWCRWLADVLQPANRHEHWGSSTA